VELRIETGVLVLETVAKIRREHFARGKGVKTIAREIGLARNTVRKPPVSSSSTATATRWRPRRRGGRCRSAPTPTGSWFGATARWWPTIGFLLRELARPYAERNMDGHWQRKSAKVLL